MGRHSTSYYDAAVRITAKQAIISQQRIISNIICLWIKNSLNTDAKRKLRYFKTSYTFNNQYHEAVIFFVIVKMVRPVTREGRSYIKTNLKTMRMFHLNNDTPKANLYIAEWMNKISISGETCSEILRQKFNLYLTSSCPLFKDYMETRRIEWKEDRDFTAEQVRATELNNSNNLLTSGRWPNKDPNDAHILALVGVSQKLAYNLKKHKRNRKGIQQMNNQPTSGTSHPGLWNGQKGEW